MCNSDEFRGPYFVGAGDRNRFVASFNCHYQKLVPFLSISRNLAANSTYRSVSPKTKYFSFFVSHILFIVGRFGSKNSYAFP